MQQGQRLLAEVLLTTVGVDGDITIRLRAGSGLTIEGNSTFQFNQQQLTPKIRLPIEVLAESSGSHLIHIYITETRHQQVLTRALALVFDVK